MALQIRQMDMKDIMGVVAIVRQEMHCTDNSSDIYDRVMRMYRDENYTIFVAEQEGTVIGFAGVMRSLAFEREGDFVRVLALSVRKEYDGSGVETQLMGRVEDDALGRGAYAIVINSGLKRGDFHAFCSNMGYEKSGYSFVKPLPRDREPSMSYHDIFAPIPHREG
ncbi:MAG: GNAT family N-acetyltransferase [Clostridia bacterium]|nr:GNAT family N-acetyltransferase [Clostridia bacterium]